MAASRVVFVIYLVLLTGVFTSCSAPIHSLEEDNCIVKPVPCEPSSFAETVIDTSLLYPGNVLYAIEQLPSPYNTDNGDNAITFLSKGSSATALVSSDRITEDGMGTQQIFSGTFNGLFVSTELNEIQKSTLRSRMGETICGMPIYCPNDGRIYYSAPGITNDPNDFDIYSAKLESKKNEYFFTDVKRISSVSREYSFESYPALSADGKILFVCTDRPGGYGGTDIWYAKRASVSSDKWSELKNIASSVNTPCDEVSPSISHDGRLLYFASNGHSTVGGYDIFSSEMIEETFRQATNFGKQVNTVYDEITPYQLNDTLFFFTSNQPASHLGRNIFALHRKQIPHQIVEFSTRRRAQRDPFSGRELSATEKRQIENAMQDTSAVLLTGRVGLVNDSNKVPPDVTVFVRDTKEQKEIERKSVDPSGEYSVELKRGKEYDVGAESRDKFFDLKRVDLRNFNDSLFRVPTLLVPDTLLLRINFPFDDYSNPYDFTIDDNGDQAPFKWQTSLDLIASSIKPEMSRLKNVVLYGHTDSAGSDTYNTNLARNRANFVAKELEKRGVPRKLIKIIPMGRTKPVGRRENEVQDIYDLRCRRVEFIKIFK